MFDRSLPITNQCGCTWLPSGGVLTSNYSLISNCLIVTGYHFPIRVSSSAGSSVFAEHDDLSELLLPHNKRAVNNQISSMSCLLGIVQQQFMPVHAYTSLHRLGLASQVRGCARSACVPCHVVSRTNHEVRKYIALLNASKALFLPISFHSSKTSYGIEVG